MAYLWYIVSNIKLYFLSCIICDKTTDVEIHAKFKEEFSKNSLPCSLLSDQRKDMNTDNSDLSWFEKDLEDFDVLDDAGEGNSDEDDTTSKILWFKHDVCTKE